MSNKRFNKICGICGDKASGFNFNVISCESCKAFFRRNCGKSEKLRCFLGGNCKIDESNRKCCKSCRMKKCIELGMRSELILTEKEKEFRRHKIIENKSRKQKIIEELLEICDSKTTSSDPNTSQELFKTNANQEIIKSNTAFDDISDAVYQKVVELEFSVIPIVRPIGFSNSFNDLEDYKLQELLEAIKSFQTPLASNITIATNFMEAIDTMVDKCDHEIRRIIEMSKGLNAFQNLCENDKIFLIKYSSIEIICLRMILYFNSECNYLDVITDRDISTLVNVDLLLPGKRNYCIDQKNFFNKISPEWDLDSNIIDLLTAIVLFEPNRPNITHRESVKLQQNIYLYLLQRYLRIRYDSECVSNTKFLRLLNCLTDLNIINEKVSLNWMEANPQKMKPLLKEISDRNVIKH